MIERSVGHANQPDADWQALAVLLWLPFQGLAQHASIAYRHHRGSLPRPAAADRWVTVARIKPGIVAMAQSVLAVVFSTVGETKPF